MRCIRRGCPRRISAEGEVAKVMNHIDPEAIKFFWWAVSWILAAILSIAVSVIIGTITLLIITWIGIRIAAFIKNVF